MTRKPRPAPQRDDAAHVRAVVGWIYATMLADAAHALTRYAAGNAQLRAVADAMHRAAALTDDRDAVAAMTDDDALPTMLADIVDALGDAQTATTGRTRQAVQCVIATAQCMAELRDRVLGGDIRAIYDLAPRATDIVVDARTLTVDGDVDPQRPPSSITFTRRPKQ